VALRTFATFESAMASDAVEDGYDHIKVPAGCALISSLREQMTAKGWRCIEPRQHSFYGWAFDVEEPTGLTTVLLQYPGPWLLVASRRQSFWQRLLGRTDDMVGADILASLHHSLVQGPASSAPRWYTRAEYDRSEPGPGAETPL
jgi:hypothetical protein